MRQPRGWIAAAALLAALVPAATGRAQQAPVNSNRLMFDPNGLQGTENRSFTPQQPASTVGQQAPSTKPSAAPAAKQAAPAKPPAAPTATPAAAPKPPQRATASPPPRTAAARRAPATETASDPAKPGSRAAVNAAPIETPRLGRVPLTTGTFGFENQTQLKDYNMSDGRKVPGFDNIQRNDSSYFGLSLRMPTGTSSPSLLRDHGAN